MFGDVYERFDTMFLVLLGVQYFNQGSKVLTGLATQNLFKESFNLDPGYVEVLSGIIALPWTFKILYGLISDNVPIYGSKRRSYCVLLSSVQLISCLLLTALADTNVYFSTLLLTIMSLTVAAMDVIVDSIMVI